MSSGGVNVLGSNYGYDFGSIEEAGLGAYEQLQSGIAGAKALTSKSPQEVVSSIALPFGTMMTFKSGLPSKIGRAIGGKIKGAFNDIQELAERKAGMVADRLSGQLENAQQVGQGAVDDITSNVSRMTSDLVGGNVGEETGTFMNPIFDETLTDAVDLTDPFAEFGGGGATATATGMGASATDSLAGVPSALNSEELAQNTMDAISGGALPATEGADITAGQAPAVAETTNAVSQSVGSGAEQGASAIAGETEGMAGATGASTGAAVGEAVGEDVAVTATEATGEALLVDPVTAVIGGLMMVGGFLASIFHKKHHKQPLFQPSSAQLGE